jgi:hypothetical protein
MAPFSTKLEPIREFFLLRSSERVVRGYAASQRVLVERHVDAAARRLSAGRRIPQSVPAALLLRDAVKHYLFAIKAARDVSLGEAALDTMDCTDIPVLGPDPLRPDVIPTDDARVRAALRATSPLYFDRLSDEDAALTRDALDRAASMLRRRVEARSLASVVGTRWGRLGALALVVVYVAVTVVHAKVWPRNIALGKPVHASSLAGGDGHELVDGELGAVPLRTNTDESPSAAIDLGRGYRIDRVSVYNRVDGWFDDCLPLVVEFSTDGAKYAEIARRETHFGADPPWTVDGKRELARYVRVRLARRGYLALSEVEVFGKAP